MYIYNVSTSLTVLIIIHVTNKELIQQDKYLP